MKKTLIIVLGVLVLGSFGGAGAVKWRAYARDQRDERALSLVKELMTAGKWREAERVARDHHRLNGRATHTAQLKAWRKAEFRIAGQLRDLPKLTALAEVEPEVVATDEAAALWLVRTYDSAGIKDRADAVRQIWSGHEMQPVNWLCAEADQLIQAKRLDDAKQLLAKQVFSGKDDVPRLLRLALISADQPREVTRLLDEAYRRDPTNADVRSLRGQVLEKVGQSAFARMEFVAALASDPANPLMRDQLAEYYLRQRNLTQAAQTLVEKLPGDAPEFLWEKAVFISRLIGRPGPDATTLPESRRGSYAGWLASLPTAKFWDETSYQALHLSSETTAIRPSAFWFNVIDRLAANDESAVALSLTEARAGAVSLAPSLHASLRLALKVRSGQEIADAGIQFPAAIENEHQFIRRLRAAASGRITAKDRTELTEVLRSKNGIAACFLAEGWIAPALALADTAAAPNAPEWLQYGIVHATRDVQGVKAALALADVLRSGPNLDYLRAEMALSVGREAEALALLRRVAQGGSEAAYNAGWLASTRLIELKRFDEARAVINECLALRSATSGAELSARLALLQGDTPGAERQYRAIGSRSLEAGAFLARQAYAARDWPEARRLTQFWLEKYPDDLQLRRNLAAVAEQERSQ